MADGITHEGTIYQLPFADLFRPLTAAERGRLEASISLHGVKHPVLTFDSKVWGARCVLDGANRLGIAADIGAEVPFTDLGVLSEATARELAVSLNADRRHLSPDEQAAARAARVERVAESRKQGESIRAIAQQEKVSPAQVVRDLEDKGSTVPGGTVETPEKVIGKDGKKRSAKAKPKPKQDKDVTSESSTPDPSPPARAQDSDCSGVSGSKDGSDEPASPVPTRVVPPPAVDAWGIPVQPHAAEAFAAVPKFRELLGAIQTAQRLFNEVANLPGGVFLTMPDVSSYRRGKKGADGGHADRFVHEGMERAYQQVKNAAPTHTVCPWHYVEAAHPVDCRACKQLNWTPVLGSNVPEAAVAKIKEVFGV